MFLTVEMLEMADANSHEKVSAREQMNKFQEACDRYEAEGAVKADHKHTHHFSDLHPIFGCHIYGREVFVPANSVITGKIHKHPTMNILVKGKLIVMSEDGKRVVEAPATYMAKTGERKVGYTLEDCVWITVILTNKAGEENIDDIIEFQTTMSYAELGLKDSLQSMRVGEK
jgi:hypothetical protein